MSLSERVVKKILSSDLIRQLYSAVAKIFFYGKSRYCPVCKNRIFRFLPKRKQPCRCPVCFSEPRHRLAWLYLEQHTNIFDNHKKELLHVAPELCLMDAFKKCHSIQYLSADMSSSLAMTRLDLTDIQYEDGTFDAIYCSHVLEHIKEDHLAIKEMFRVLKPQGWAIIMVPIAGVKTTERSEPNTPGAENFSGHPDHVRRYGFDLKNKLENAGLSVTVESPTQKMTDTQKQ